MRPRKGTQLEQHNIVLLFVKADRTPGSTYVTSGREKTVVFARIAGMHVRADRSTTAIFTWLKECSEIPVYAMYTRKLPSTKRKQPKMPEYKRNGYFMCSFVCGRLHYLVYDPRHRIVAFPFQLSDLGLDDIAHTIET